MLFNGSTLGCTFCFFIFHWKEKYFKCKWRKVKKNISGLTCIFYYEKPCLLWAESCRKHNDGLYQWRGFIGILIFNCINEHTSNQNKTEKHHSPRVRELLALWFTFISYLEFGGTHNFNAKHYSWCVFFECYSVGRHTGAAQGSTVL